MTEKSYICSCCGGEFVSDRSDAEAIAEFHDAFKNVPEDQANLVCDDCYPLIMNFIRQSEAAKR